MKEQVTNKLGKTTRKHTINRMHGNQNNFGVDNGNQEKITKNSKRMSNITKDLEGLKEGLKVEKHRFT